MRRSRRARVLSPAVRSFVFVRGGTRSWQNRLRDRINSTLDSGGRVYVAAHVFDTHSYKDLSQANNPFNEQINPRYLTLNSTSFRQQIEDFFSGYDLTKSDFSLGADNYLFVGPKGK